MKILNVNHLLDPELGGGTAERTFQLGCAFVQAGAACSILTLDIGNAQRAEMRSESLQIIRLPCLNQRYFIPWVPGKLIDRLVAEADIVHLTGHWTVLNALVYRACQRQRKAFVFCPAGALLPFGRSRLLKILYDRLVGRRLARSAAACVAITSAECSDLLAYQVSPDQMCVIPNGIDPASYPRASPRDEREFRVQIGVGDAPYILFLGRLNEIKGPDILLHAFIQAEKYFPEMHLVFAGPDGGMLQDLKQIAAASLVAKRIHFIGYIEGLAKAVTLQMATLMVIPSRREAMSIVVLEAGICGIPVLFTNRCGLDEVARDGAGKMVGVSAQEIANGLTELLTHRSALQDSANRLNTLVKKNYLWKNQADRYLEVFTKILSKEA